MDATPGARHARVLKHPLERVHTVPAGPLELALVDGVPRDDVHVRHEVVLAQQGRKLTCVLVSVVHTCRVGGVQDGPFTPATLVPPSLHAHGCSRQSLDADYKT